MKNSSFALRHSQLVSDFLGLETEWARGSFVDNLPPARDDVDAVGPRGIIVFDFAIEVIDNQGEPPLVALQEDLRQPCPLLPSLGLIKDEAVLDVDFKLPLVVGVGLTDVDGQEIGSIPVVIVEFVEIADLPAEDISRAAGKYQDDLFFGVES